MSASYNDWESDLSSIIEKTNQNLKLLRRIGEKRTDDVTTTSRPTSASMGNASDLRSAVHHRYAAEDAASASYRPRVMSSTASASRKHATMRASPMASQHDNNYDSEDVHSVSRPMRRSTSATGSKTLKSSSAATIRVHEADMPSDVPNYVLDEIKKRYTKDSHLNVCDAVVCAAADLTLNPLEVNISARSSVFEKKIGDLRTDFTVLTNETTTLSHKFAELRDSVMSKMSNVPGVLQSLQENTDAITRLEKHSAALLGWKVGMEQDLFEITSKIKNFTSLQDKMGKLEGNLDSLATALKNRPRHDEKIEELRDKVATVERHQSSFVDIKAVEHLLGIRLPRELHELEGRMNQSIALLSEKLEAKMQNVEKSLQSQRTESMATMKSELVEDIQRLSTKSLRKTDIVPLQNAQSQLKEDLSQLNGFLERQDKRIQDFKQTSTQIREELVETRQELTKALHAQQSRVAASLDERMVQLSTMSKEKNVKVDQQMATLSKKQKKVEEHTKLLHEDIAKVRQDMLQKQNASHLGQQKENEKLRERLARSVAELESLTLAKVDLERHYGKQEKQFQAKLKALHAKLEESEKLKEFERLELVQKIQEETKLMGIAQGKNALLEALLAKEKLQNVEKNDLIHQSRQEMNAIRQKMRSVEHEVEKKMHALASDLHSKQLQVEALARKLKKSEDEAAKLLESSKRDVKAVRRAKVTKEHELSIAKLKLKEMENAASSLSQANGGGEDTRQASEASKRIVEAAEAKRKAMEQLLLEAQLQVDELNQEMEEMKQEYAASGKQEKASMSDDVHRLSAEYEAKIMTLNAEIAAKDEALRRVRDTLVEKSEFDALDDELRTLKEEKMSLLASLERVHSEHSRVLLEHESKAHLLHEKDMEMMKKAMEVKLTEIDEARVGLENCRGNISRLEMQLKDQERSHAEELSSLMEEIKATRATIAACTSEVTDLQAEKARLEQELEEIQCALDSFKAEADEKELELNEKLGGQEIEMQRQVDQLSSRLADRESELVESKQSDERNREKLVAMVSEQEEMERQLRSEMDSLSLALDHERGNSKAREQDMESAMLTLQSELDMMRIESQQAATSYQSSVAAELAELASTLKESQSREQRLQKRLVAIVKEVAQAASGFDVDTQVDISGSEDDDSLAAKYLDRIRETQRGTISELQNLQIDYEMSVKQAAEDARNLHTMDAQVRAYKSQIEGLEAVVANLQCELKAQYEHSAKHSGDLEQEIATLKQQKHELELVVESKSSECDEKQALFDREIESKQDRVELLRKDNAKLSMTIEGIRTRMESIEVSRARELDEMSMQLTELEAQAASYTVPTHGSGSDFDADFYSNHQKIVVMAQDLRSLYVRLTKSVGVLDWTDLRASVFDEEDKLERLRQERNREASKLESAEQEILLNADFLKAVLALRDSEQHGARGDWIEKYVSSAPEMVQKLKNLEARLREAMAKTQQPTTTVLSLNPDSLDDPTDEDSDELQSDLHQTERCMHSEGVHPDFNLSESCESREFVEESQSHELEGDDAFDDEESVEEDDSTRLPFDGREDLSESAEMNESSLEISARDVAFKPSQMPTSETPHHALTHEQRNADSHADVMDPCTNLMRSSAPAELLSTPFVAPPSRQTYDELEGSSDDRDQEEHACGDTSMSESLNSEEDGASQHLDALKLVSTSEMSATERYDERIGRDGVVMEMDRDPQMATTEGAESDLSDGDGDSVEGHQDTRVDGKVSSHDHHFHDEMEEDEESDASRSFDDRETEYQQRRGHASTDVVANTLVKHGEIELCTPVGQSSQQLNHSDRMGMDLSTTAHGDQDDTEVVAERSSQIDSEEEEDHDIDSDEELEESTEAEATPSVHESASVEEPRATNGERVTQKSDSEHVGESAMSSSADHLDVEAAPDRLAKDEDGLHRSQDDIQSDGEHHIMDEEGEMDEEDSSEDRLDHRATGSVHGSDVRLASERQHLRNEGEDEASEDEEDEGDEDEDERDVAPEGEETHTLELHRNPPSEKRDLHESDEGELQHSDDESSMLESDEEFTSETQQQNYQERRHTLHERDEDSTPKRPSYHMEEESEEDDMDEVERMLLANSLEIDEHSESGGHGEEESLDGSGAQKHAIAESPFDGEEVVPTGRSSEASASEDGEHDGEELESEGVRRQYAGHLVPDSHDERFMEEEESEHNSRSATFTNVHVDKCERTGESVALGREDEGSDLLAQSGDRVDDSQDKLSSADATNNLQESCDDEEGGGMERSVDRMKLVSGVHEKLERGIDGHRNIDSEEDHEQLSEDGQSENSFDHGAIDSSFEDPSGETSNTNDMVAEPSMLSEVGQGGRRALVQHMSYSRAQVDDDEDLDEVEMLMREQSGRGNRRMFDALTSTVQAEEETMVNGDGSTLLEHDEDDELIDSESEEDTSVDSSRGVDATTISDQLTVDARAEDGAANGAVNVSQNLQRAEEVRARDEDSDDDQCDSAGWLSNTAIQSEYSVRHRATSEEDQTADALDASLRSEEEHGVLRQSGLQNEEENSDEEDEFDHLGANRSEWSLPAAPIKVQSQLAPLPSGSRLGGAGALKKALSAASRDVDDEEDGEMDEVERLMLEQSLGRAKTPVPSAQANTPSLAKTHETATDSEDDDDDEFGSGFNDLRESHDNDGFEEHDLNHRMEDDHDESFDGPFGATQVRRNIGTGNMERNASAATSFDDASERNLYKTSIRGESRSHNDADDEDSEEFGAHSSRRPPLSRGNTTSVHSLEPLSRNPMDFGIGRRVHLDEEDEEDDMDEVERLLLEQSSMKQPTSKQTGLSQQHFTETNECDDEFGEGSIDVPDQQHRGQSAAPVGFAQSTHHFRAPSTDPVRRGTLHSDSGDVSQEEGEESEGDIDNASDEETSPVPRTARSFAGDAASQSSDSGASSPTASTRIPIFNGSNLADRVGTDTIPSMLAQQASAVESDIRQQPHCMTHADDDDGDDGEEEYLEESFDLEESLQEEDDDE